MEITLDDLRGLTPIAQGRKLFGEDRSIGLLPAKQACFELRKLWPLYTPQYKLFDKLADKNIKDYDAVVKMALYESANKLQEICLSKFNLSAHGVEKELHFNLLRELTGQKKAIKKTNVNEVDMYRATLIPASECYRRIATYALPDLKIQTIRFKDEIKADAVSVLTDSIVAHNLIYSLHSMFKDRGLYELCESSEGFPSYISEAFNVGISDIRKRLADGEKDSTLQLAPLLDARNGDIRLTTLDEVLRMYEE